MSTNAAQVSSGSDERRPGWLVAPIADDEAQRLDELRSLRILDTACEERFDRITRLACDVFRTPIALVSLVDAERQWFKSRCGLDAVQTPRDVAFCAHAILGADVFVVADAVSDPRFAANPLVTGEPQVRFYAGAVLRGPAGHALGTLCVIDRRPREFSDEDRQRLMEFARIVERELVAKRELESLAERVLDSAYRDPQIGLPNRRLVTDRLRNAVEQARSAASAVAVLHARVNDLSALLSDLPEAAAVTLVREIAGRLVGALGAAVTVGRWDAEEFLIVAPCGHDPNACARLACTALGAFEAPFATPLGEMDLTLSVGASVFPEHGADAETVRAHAASALPPGGGERGGSVVVFEGERGEELRERVLLARQLRGAPRRGELRLLFQPKADLRTGQVASLEALLRWQHPERGCISPDEFIPIAESSGSIHAIGRWALQEALDQAALLRRALGRPVPVAVNVSALQLAFSGLVEPLREMLGRHADAAQLLELEITETLMIADPEASLAVLHEIRALGLGLSLDDFGAGYSSFAYLRRMPVDEVKIDRSFVTSLEGDAAGAAILKAIVEMAHALGKRVVAEGLETRGQLATLRELGVDLGQGYLISPPVPAGALASLLAGNLLGPRAAASPATDG